MLRLGKLWLHSIKHTHTHELRNKQVEESLYLLCVSAGIYLLTYSRRIIFLNIDFLMCKTGGTYVCTTVLMKVQVFWDVMPCWVENCHQTFGRVWCYPLSSGSGSRMNFNIASIMSPTSPRKPRHFKCMEVILTFRIWAFQMPFSCCSQCSFQFECLLQDMFSFQMKRFTLMKKHFPVGPLKVKIPLKIMNIFSVE